MSTPPLVDNRKDSTGHSFTYKTVQLKDGNIWLAENFNYYVGRWNDDTCQGFDGGEDIEGRSNGCYYQWNALGGEVIPDGWHLPTVDEFTALITAYGGAENAYSALLEGGSSGMNLTLGGGTYFPNQSCAQLAGNNGWFWSSSEGRNTDFAALLYLSKDAQKADIKYLNKKDLFSVRLVKNK